MGTNGNLAQGLQTAQTMIDVSWQGMFAQPEVGVYGVYTEPVDPVDGETVLEKDFIAPGAVMRKWKGARQHRNSRHYNYTLTADPYEATLDMPRSWFDHDRTGLIKRHIDTTLGQNVSAIDKHVAVQFFLSSGVGPTGFDGVALFSASHPHGPSGNQSNLDAGTNLSHAALVTADYTAALWQHENGEPTNTMFDVLHVGPKLKTRAIELVGPERMQPVSNAGAGDASSNVVAAVMRTSVWNGKYKVVVDPRHSGFNWTMVDTSKPAKPMLLFKLTDPEITACVDPNDPRVFELDTYSWGLRGEMGIGAGHWHTAYRGTGTA